MILAIDTSTDACSVACGSASECQATFELAPRGHAQRLLPMVQQVLGQAATGLKALDALAFTAGPGSFTGLRVAAGVVQGLAFASGKPVIPVSTLASLALAYVRESALDAINVLSLLDARMNEIYMGAYRIEEGRVTALTEDQLLPPGQVVSRVPSAEGGWHVVGSGLVYREHFSRGWLQQHVVREAPAVYPTAAAALQLAWQSGLETAMAAEQALPVYLRDEVAWKKATPVAGIGGL